MDGKSGISVCYIPHFFIEYDDGIPLFSPSLLVHIISLHGSPSSTLYIGTHYATGYENRYVTCLLFWYIFAQCAPQLLPFPCSPYSGFSITLAKSICMKGSKYVWYSSCFLCHRFPFRKISSSTLLRTLRVCHGYVLEKN